MPDFYIIAQNDADTAFDVVRSSTSRLTNDSDIVSLVQSKTMFPPGGVIRCEWHSDGLKGRLSPDCTCRGKRARTALFYSPIPKKEELPDVYFAEVRQKLQELLGEEISEALLQKFTRTLKATVKGGLGRLKMTTAFFVILFLVVVIIWLVK